MRNHTHDETNGEMTRIQGYAIRRRLACATARDIPFDFVH